MSSITTINSGDNITNSRAVINNNFAALNNDKIETSVIDTDTTLAADSDAKLPTQKAVKAFVNSTVTSNATESVKGSVEIATQSEVNAGTATGGTGAPLAVTPATLKANLLTKVVASPARTEIADNSTVETNIFSQTIDANTLGTANVVRFKVYVQDLTSFSNTLDDFTIRLKYGATTLCTVSFDNASAPNTLLKGYIEGVLFADGSTSAQFGTLLIDMMQDDLTFNAAISSKGLRSFSTGTSAIDSTTSQTLALTLQWATNNTANNFIPAGRIIELP